MYIEFGAIFACPSLTGATPFNKSPVESCGFVEGCGAWGETALKNRTKLNLPSLWVLPDTDFYAQDFLVPARL
ncbi:hypothetical protein [Collinsella sp. An271]|uniref:hypothetical protein n=1 Tax=Collinsella sp. An271 TaxID=1965616 RepID=UPI00117C4137|nr:hypothetical protein [Collinsella sp. An271]